MIGYLYYYLKDNFNKLYCIEWSRASSVEVSKFKRLTNYQNIAGYIITSLTAMEPFDKAETTFEFLDESLQPDTPEIF